MEQTHLPKNYRLQLLTTIHDSKWITRAAWVVSFAVLTALLAQIRIYAPWNPWVPYTGQVMGVALSGLVLGPWLGAASMLLYLILGAIGLPVFADASGGIEVLLGPTAGYLFGFVVACYLTGSLSRAWLKGRREGTLARLGVATLAAMVAAFGIGAAVLGLTGVLATQGLGASILVASIAIAGVSLLLLIWSKDESQAFLARLACGLIGVLIVYIPGTVVLHLVTGMSVDSVVVIGALQFIPVDLAKVFLAAGITGAVLPPVGGARLTPEEQGKGQKNVDVN